MGKFWQAEQTVTPFSSPSPLPSPCVCTNRPPCVDSKRPRVYGHHAHMCYHMCAWCPYTRGRFESTHGGFFLRATHTPTHTNTHTNTHTPQNTETDRHRQSGQKDTTTHGHRQTDKERERRGDERRETREGNTKEKTREECVCALVRFLFSNLPDPRIISNFQNYHYQP